MNNKKMLFGIVITFLLIFTISFTYAYFSASVSGNGSNQIVTTGTLQLRYIDGPEISRSRLMPGDTITKTVYVANPGSLAAYYKIEWSSLLNNIIGGELVMSYTCTSLNGVSEEEEGTCSSMTNSIVATSPNIISDHIAINPTMVHKYDIVLTFMNMSQNQSYNEGKTFSGTINVNGSTAS